MKSFVLIALLSLYGTKPSDPGITYRPLTWEDFKGSATGTPSRIAAETNCEIDFEWTDSAGIFNFDVKAYFLPHTSFVRVKSDQGLRHEQCHFQIAYIAALRCMSALASLQGRNEAAKVKAENIYKRFVSSWKQQNILFDNDSQHGLNSDQEEQWETRMSYELEQLLTNGRN